MLEGWRGEGQGAGGAGGTKGRALEGQGARRAGRWRGRGLEGQGAGGVGAKGRALEG